MPADREIQEGSTEYVDVTVTSLNDYDLSLDTIQVFFTATSVKKLPLDTIWINVSRTLHPATTMIRGELLIGPDGSYQLLPGRWKIWARVVDSPEIPWLASDRAVKII